MSKTLPMLALILAAGVTVTSDAAAQWNVERFDGPANRIYTQPLSKLPSDRTLSMIGFPPPIRRV